MEDQLAELKKEVSRLRYDLDRVLEMLHETRRGETAVYLNDLQGRPRGVFQVDEEGAHFEIWNRQGQVVVSIGESADGAGEIYVAGADGKPRAGLKVTPSGGILSAQNPDGHIGALMIGKQDGGTIVVADADGRPLVEITATEGRGTVDIKQADGKQLRPGNTGAGGFLP
jgi:hypothetical protein